MVPTDKGVSPSGSGVTVKRQNSATSMLRKSLSELSQQAVSTAASVRRSSLGSKAPSSDSLAERADLPAQDDDKWRVGSRYEVGVNQVNIYATSELQGIPIATVPAKDQVVLVELQEESSNSGMVIVGHVVPKLPLVPGWVLLEDSKAVPPPVVRRRLPSSWEIGARYAVQSGATLRKGKQLCSDVAGEVEVGGEVLALQFGTNDGEDGARLRLRMMVKADSGVVGWMSPETACGDLLLEPVNLLSEKVLNYQRSPSSSKLLFGRMGSKGSDLGSAGTSVSSPTGVGKRRSYKPGGKVSWQAGGQYRILERVSMRDERWLDSKETKKISAGSLVSVTDVSLTECAGMGWCPVALVTVDDGQEKGSRGWVRCSAKDGHDVIDTRDQHEFLKVKDDIIQQMRAEEAKVAQRTEAKRAEAQRQREKAAAAEAAANSTAGKARAAIQRMSSKLSTTSPSQKGQSGCFECMLNLRSLFTKQSPAKDPLL
mmetsp:Transcript_41234/g.106684  ORF Transcript_41234/g.106684 Transcript_41234/m.106684 type:complete len:484 (+) Transcript_41234:101-1552(+)